MSIEFTHTLYRDNGTDLRDEIELEVTATVYDGDIDDVSWQPAIKLSETEEADLRDVARDELASAIKRDEDECAYYRAVHRELDRMGL